MKSMIFIAMINTRSSIWEQNGQGGMARRDRRTNQGHGTTSGVFTRTAFRYGTSSHVIRLTGDETFFPLRLLINFCHLPILRMLLRQLRPTGINPMGLWFFWMSILSLPKVRNTSRVYQGMRTLL